MQSEGNMKYTKPSSRWVVAGLLLTILSACGGGGSATPDQTPGNTTLLTPEGGKSTVDLGDGQTLSVTVPPGAVYQSQRLTWSAVEPAPGEMLAFEVSPSGMLLAKPITLKLPLNASPARPGMYFGSLDDPFFVDARWDGTELVADIQVLGGMPDDPAGPMQTLTTAAAAFFQDDAQLSAKAANDAGTAGSGILRVADLQCQVYRDNLQAALDLYVVAGRFERARQVVGAYEAMARHADCAEDLSAFVTTHQTLACSGFTSARDALAASNFAQPEEFLTLAQPVAYWAGILGVWSAQCVELDAGYAAIQDAYARLVSLYNDRIDQLDGSDPDAFTTFKRLARDLIRLEEEVLFLGVPDFAQDLRNTIDVLLDKLLSVAYRLSQENETTIYLTELTQPRFYERSRIVVGSDPEPAEWVGRPPYDYDSLQRSIHLVGTHVIFKSEDADGQTEDETTMTGGISGGTPRNTDDHIHVPYDGELVLSGWINPLECRLNQPVDDTVEFRVGNKVLLALRRDAGGAMLAEAARIPVTQALEELGLPAQNGETFTLEAVRMRSPGGCGDELLGPRESTLFTLRVDVREGARTRVYLRPKVYSLSTLEYIFAPNGPQPDEQRERVEPRYDFISEFDESVASAFPFQGDNVDFDLANSASSAGTAAFFDANGTSLPPDAYQVSRSQVELQTDISSRGSVSGTAGIGQFYIWHGAVNSFFSIAIMVFDGPARLNFSLRPSGNVTYKYYLNGYNPDFVTLISSTEIVTEINSGDMILEPGRYRLGFDGGYGNLKTCYQTCENAPSPESCRLCGDVLPDVWDKSATLNVSATLEALDVQ